MHDEGFLAHLWKKLLTPSIFKAYRLQASGNTQSILGWNIAIPPILMQGYFSALPASLDTNTA